MTTYKIKGVDGETFAKRLMKLAWDASGVFGMGRLQDRGPTVTEEQVWDNTRGRGDYPALPGVIGGQNPAAGRADADYVFGRMMKVHYKYGSDFVQGEDRPYRLDYQSFAGKYPNFQALVKATAESLGVTVE